MISVVFSNMTGTDSIKDSVLERVHALFDKFPDLGKHDIKVTLSRENSPQQAGKDHYSVRMFLRGKRYSNLSLKRSATNLYAALAEVMDRSVERLGRWSEKRRNKSKRALVAHKHRELSHEDIGVL